MRISVIGAGPAGLYFAILMKRIDPSHEISVIERNAPDATFGWGVVFSEETLGELRDADYESYLEITDAFARWDAIDIRYHGRLIRSRGHAFSAISRKALLGVLQRRAAALGVDLSFGVEVDDIETLRDADLVVGADGVNSTVRRLYADKFEPDIDTYPTKYAWFGTDLVFDAFTFVFEETEWGLFQAHAYPFDAELSTFIVECTDEVWQRAGLEKLSEKQSIAFCERLFADALQGHRLLSNRSAWMSFARVKNRSWSHENVVLLGDAAHTAHFSIGSGTKLAMEDSVALANAFVRHGELEQALVDYELARLPVVERFQDAARESAAYFENVRRYAGFEPVQFGFNLLTRSGRITYANLTLRDPRFVRELDSWFGAVAGNGSRNGRQIAPPPMFAPLRIGEVTLRNRVVVSPLMNQQAKNGMPTAAHSERLAAAAESGAGLVLTEPVAVSREGRITPDCTTIESDSEAEAWTQVTATARAAGGSLVGIQISHAGRRGATASRRHGVDVPLGRGGWPLIAASAVRYAPSGRVPRAMTLEDLERVRCQFATAAERAASAGFDALELNCGQGYLLASFLSPLANLRDDHYGGDAEGRMRFPLEVLESVRSAWPDERLLIVRLSATDWAARGATVEDAVEVAREMRKLGVDLFHVVAGQTVAESRPEYRRSFLTPFSDRIRTDADVPTLVGGYITTGDEINTIVGAGRADLCLLDTRTLEEEPAVR